MSRARPTGALVLGLVVLTLPGCFGEPVETTYGRTRGTSLNGTGVAAALFREGGHEVRTAVRLNDELGGWAEVIVRFAPTPGGIAKDEADWYDRWLTSGAGRRVIYVPRDYDALPEYWTAVLEQLLKQNGPAAKKEIARTQRDAAEGWHHRLPKVAKEVADRDTWFAVDPAKPDAVRVCASLDGPWGRGIDVGRAALPRHDTLKVDVEGVLLTGDGRPLAIEWGRTGESKVLVLANASFLLNGALVNAARRPLALRVVDWVGEEPQKVAFVEGAHLLGDAPKSPSVFTLLFVPPFGWIAGQMLVLGLAACLARAVRLGRPRPEPSMGEDRPAAHPEALGVLLVRTGQFAAARAQLDAYRQWRKRQGSQAGGLAPPR